MAKHDTKRSETHLIGEVRIAYPFLHEKRTKSAGGALLDKPRNDAVLLYPKLGPAESCPNYKRLSDMAMEAAIKAWGTWPEGGKWPVMDGDVPHPHKPKPGEKALTPEQVAERNKWRTGSWIVEVSSGLSQGPKVTILNNGVMQDLPAQQCMLLGEVWVADPKGVQLYKSGDYGYVSMNSYSFHSDQPGGKWGVNYGFEGVAYTRQGELIGGGPKSSAQMFAGIPLGAPVAPAAPGLPPLPPLSSSPPLAPAAPPMPPGVAAGAPPLPIPGR